MNLLARKMFAVVACVCTLLCAAPAAAGMVDAIEFYNGSLDHYFVTANPDEIAKLDAGVLVGWQRTQQVFKVLDPNDNSPGASPVCRFYGSPAAGLDSHFYSVSPVECAEVKQKFPTAWLLEADNVFQAYLPNITTGACPANTRPVYRTWNKRVDSNHRYTTDIAIQDQMIAKGYVAEGYGPDPAHPVAMCAPVPVTALPPSCTLSANNTSPIVGAGILLAATCSGNPTSYSWTGCTSTGTTCGATSANPGPVVYSVIAANAGGASAPANLQVNWSAAPPPPPPEAKSVCNLIVTSPHQTPVVDSLVVLQASCSGDPDGYQWTNCVSQTNVCQVRWSFPGVQSYSVSASNSGGVGTPATANVNWVASPAPPVGLCGQYPATLYTDFGSSGGLAHSYLSEAGFRWNGVWTVRFTVPSTAGASSFGSLQVAEFGGPATYRDTTISTNACDFRPVDSSGANGPLARATGNSTIIPFIIGATTPNYPGLVPGGTYYLNVRNYLAESNSITCPSPGRCDALVNINVPR
jgi:hypothetical protein